MENAKYLELVKNFKAALTNCSVYFPEHPIFSKTINNFKKKLAELSQNTPFFFIQIKPDALIINRQPLASETVQKKLASFLHQRKIKSIKIKKEVTVLELSDFLINVSAGSGDIIAKGGIKKILEDKKVKNIEIEELDYSHLLKGQGVEIKDAWNYLFALRLDSQNNLQKNKFLNNLKETVDKFGVKEVLEDQNLSEKLLDFFTRLESKTGSEAKEVLKKISASVLENENVEKIQNKEKLKVLFSRLSPEDLADLLSEIFQKKSSMNESFFDLFSLLVPDKTHEKTAQILKKKMEKGDKKIAVNKIKDIFSSSKKEGAVPVYQKNLAKNGVFLTGVKKFSFDWQHLESNYRLALLDLFFYGKNPKFLEILLEKIKEIVETDFSTKINYLEKFGIVYREKKGQMSLVFLQDKIKNICHQAEKSIFEANNPESLNFLEELLKDTTLDLFHYFKKIETGKSNRLVFRLFFKFFSGKIDQLKEKIFNKKKDFNFLLKIIAGLSGVNHPAVEDIFGQIYNLCPLSRKMEMLDKLKKYLRCDSDFVINLAKNQNFYLRKKAAEIALNFPQMQEEVMRTLLVLPNFLGSNTRIILENLDILKETYAPVARPFLNKLISYKFFWNKKIREEASGILKERDEK